MRRMSWGERQRLRCLFVFCWKAGGMDRHISQVPGPAPTTETEDSGRGQRSRIHDSDSDYIKLAKRGGHKGSATTRDFVAHTFIIYLSPLGSPSAFHRTFVARGHICS